MDPHLQKICEAMPSKKQKQLQQESDVLASEQLSNGPPLNTGSMMNRKPSDKGSQRLDNRPKSVINRNPSDIGSQMPDDRLKTTKKRPRTSVAKAWMESKNSGFVRQPLVVTKEGDMLKDNDEDSDVFSHNKLKRSRCVAPVFSRSVGSDGEQKQSMRHKLTMESTLQASDSTCGFGLSNHEENRATDFNLVFKGKASRTPRTAGNLAAANVHRLSGTMESREPVHSNKTPAVGGSNNSLCMLKWGGRRLKKDSRTKRKSIATLSNQDEIQVQCDGCLPSGFGSRINSSLISDVAANGNQKFKPENVPPPVRLSESEKYGAGEIRIKDNKGVVHREFEEKIVNADQNVGTSAIALMDKNMVKRQEHIGREKMDTVVPSKTFQNERSDSDKIGRKSGRPMNKHSDHRGFSRVGSAAHLELDVHQDKGMRISDSISCRRSECMKDTEFDQLQLNELDSACPLYLRLQSAMIGEEVEIEEYEETELVDPCSFGDSFVNGSENKLEYGEMPFGEKLVVELECLGIILEEGVDIKKTDFDQIHKAAEGENARDPTEKVAMDKLVEVTHKKLVATDGTLTTERAIPIVPKQATVAFNEKALARCHKFEESGVSCFFEPPSSEIVHAAPTNGSSVDKVDAPIQPSVTTVVGNPVEAPIHPSVDRNVVEPPIHESVTSIGKNVAVSVGKDVAVANRRRKRDALLGDIGIKDPSPSIYKKKRTKLKNKKAAQPSKLPNATDTPKESTELKLPNSTDTPKESIELKLPNSTDTPKESTELAKMPVNNIHSIEELGADPEITERNDFDDLFSLEDMLGVQEFDGIGLEIPNDNLTDISLSFY